MAIAVKCSSCGHEYQIGLLDDEGKPCPECDKPAGAPADAKPAEQNSEESKPPDTRVESESAGPKPAESKTAVFQVSPADVIAPKEAPLPKLKTYEELGIDEKFRKAVEEELAREEKVVWLGRPSRNREVYPDSNKILAIIGGVLVCLAIALPLLIKGMPFIFPIVLGLLACVFLAGAYFANPANAYQACYVVTNRRALLLETGLIGGFNLANLTMKGVRRKSWEPKGLTGMERQNNLRVSGAGDLVFEYEFQIGRGVMNNPTTTGTIQNTSTPQRIARGFAFLDDVREAERVIRSQLLGELEKQMDSGSAPATAEMAPPISVACACGARMEAPESLAGKSVKCPQCSAAVALPAPEKPTAANAFSAKYREDGPIPEEIKEKAIAELGTNERLVWMGKPADGIVLRRNLAWLAGGGVVALGCLLWITGAIGFKEVQQPGRPPAAAPTRNNGPAILLLLISLGVISVPGFRLLAARRTGYALTNRRALVFKGGVFGSSRESYPPSELIEMHRSDSWIAPGGGDVIFRSVTVITTSRNQEGKLSKSSRTIHYGFLSIYNPQDVERLIRETLVTPVHGKVIVADIAGSAHHRY
jgi:hypothetical protein